MNYLCFLIFSFCLLFTLSCNRAAAPISVSNTPVSDSRLPPSKPIEQMTWTKIDMQTNLDGGINKLADLQGKVVILDFWATYCPPCIEEIPHLKSLQEKYGKDNLVVIGLNVGGPEDRPKIPAFSEKLKIDYPIATPEDELTSFIFGDRSDIPQTAVFDRQGKLVEKFIGFSPTIKDKMDAAIEKTINSK